MVPPVLVFHRCLCRGRSQSAAALSQPADGGIPEVMPPRPLAETRSRRVSYSGLSYMSDHSSGVVDGMVGFVHWYQVLVQISFARRAKKNKTEQVCDVMYVLEHREAKFIPGTRYFFPESSKLESSACPPSQAPHGIVGGMAARVAWVSYSSCRRIRSRLLRRFRWRGS